jgi:hypothetical protein
MLQSIPSPLRHRRKHSKAAFSLLLLEYVRFLSWLTQAVESDEEVFGAAQGRVIAVGWRVGGQARGDESAGVITLLI